MVNDHVGPKGNRLKVSESPFGTITCLKSGYMAWKKRIGKTLEIRLSAGGNESRDAGVADKHYFFVVIKTHRGGEADRRDRGDGERRGLCKKGEGSRSLPRYGHRRGERRGGPVAELSIRIILSRQKTWSSYPAHGSCGPPSQFFGWVTVLRQ